MLLVSYGIGCQFNSECHFCSIGGGYIAARATNAVIFVRAKSVVRTIISLGRYNCEIESLYRFRK